MTNKYFTEYENLINDEIKKIFRENDIRLLIYRNKGLKIINIIENIVISIPKNEKTKFYKNWNNAIELFYKIENKESKIYNEIAIERVIEIINDAVKLKIDFSTAPQYLLKISKQVLSKNIFLYLLEKNHGNIPINQLNFYNKESLNNNNIEINIKEIYNAL